MQIMPKSTISDLAIVGMTKPSDTEDPWSSLYFLYYYKCTDTGTCLTIISKTKPSDTEDQFTYFTSIKVHAFYLLYYYKSTNTDT